MLPVLDIFLHTKLYTGINNLAGNSMDDLRGENWILTFSGIMFYPLDPHPEEIDIEDIAVALSRLPRYTGHTRFTYVVGQHSCYVCDILYKKYKSPSLALRGLLHDGSETYTNDISSPLKKLKLFEEFREVEHRLQACIYKTFGLEEVNEEHDRLVKQADREVFHTEVLTLVKRNDKMRSRLEGIEKANVKIKRWSEEEVKQKFLDRYYRYRNV